MKKLSHKKEYDLLKELIYRLRMKAGVTQKELADKLSTPQSYISKIESGERKIDLVELREICLSLGSNLNEIVFMYEKELNEA